MQNSKLINIKQIGKGGLSTIGDSTLIENDESPLMYNMIPTVAGLVETRRFGTEQLGDTTDGKQVLEFLVFPLCDKCNECATSECDNRTFTCQVTTCKNVYVKFVAKSDKKTYGYYMREDKTTWTEFTSFSCWHQFRSLFDSCRLYFSNGANPLRYACFIQKDSDLTGVQVAVYDITCGNTYCKYSDINAYIYINTRDTITNKASGLLALDTTDAECLDSGFKTFLNSNTSTGSTGVFSVFADTGVGVSDVCSLDSNGIPKGYSEFKFTAPYIYTGNKIIATDVIGPTTDPNIYGPVYIRYNNATTIRITKCGSCDTNKIADAVQGYDVRSWKGRMFVGGDLRGKNRGLVWYSKGNDTDAVKCLNIVPDFRGDAFNNDPNPSDFIDLFAADNAEFVCFSEVGENLFIHAKSEGKPILYKVSTNSTTNPFTKLAVNGFTVQKVAVDTGVNNLRGVTVFENQQVFIQKSANTATGITYGLFQGYIADSSRDIGTKVRPTFALTNWDGGAIGVWDRKEFYAGVIDNECTSEYEKIEYDACTSDTCNSNAIYKNNRIIVRDRDLGAFYEIKNWGASLFLTNDKGFYFGSSTSGDVYKVSSNYFYDFKDEQNNLIEIDSYYSFKSFHLNQPLQNKKLMSISWDGYIEEGKEITFGINFDCAKTKEKIIKASSICTATCSGCEEENLCAVKKGAKYYQYKLKLPDGGYVFKTMRPYFKSNGAYFGISNMTIEVSLDASDENATLCGELKNEEILLD